MQVHLNNHSLKRKLDKQFSAFLEVKLQDCTATLLSSFSATGACLKADLLKLFNLFYNHDTDISRINYTFAAMISKKQNCKMVRDYRPISLMNGVLKIITKTLCIRLSKIISSLIINAQSAFIKGRQINDSFLNAVKIIAISTKSKSWDLALELDFEKAFDNVKWSFIIAILRARGFAERWCKWIENILSSNKMALLINGAPTNWINTK